MVSDDEERAENEHCQAVALAFGHDHGLMWNECGDLKALLLRERAAARAELAACIAAMGHHGLCNIKQYGREDPRATACDCGYELARTALGKEQG